MYDLGVRVRFLGNVSSGYLIIKKLFPEKANRCGGNWLFNRSIESW
jgi:hypothetical protein